MIFNRKEFDFIVREPYMLKNCIYNRCKNIGSFSVIIKNDESRIVAQYNNICDKHIIAALLDHFEEKD
jgi:hypothetical protein